MDFFVKIISIIVGIPLILVICGLIGFAFRGIVMKDSFEKGGDFIQVVKSVIIGIIVIFILQTIYTKLGFETREIYFSKP